MLIPNLSVLLAERRLTISRVSQDTRLSRTTLTALASGSAKGIQFDTLNTLCQYLKTTPGELFIYRPFDLSLSATGDPGRSRVVFTVSRSGGRVQRCALDCDAQYRFAPGEPPRLDGLNVRLSPPKPDDQEAADLVRLLRDLPPAALTALELEILARFDEKIDPTIAPDDYAPSLCWPWQ